MKFTIFATTMAAVSTAIVNVEEPWFDGQMFGQVQAETLNFGEVFDDSADFFIQINSEERNSLGQVLLQTKSKVDDFISNMHPADRESFDTIYAQTRESAFNWLSQIQEEDRARVGEMLSQTSYGQYFMQTGIREEVADSINNYFAQLTWGAEPETENGSLAQVDAGAEDEELEEMADFLAQLDDDQMERLNVLI